MRRLYNSLVEPCVQLCLLLSVIQAITGGLIDFMEAMMTASRRGHRLLLQQMYPPAVATCVVATLDTLVGYYHIHEQHPKVTH